MEWGGFSAHHRTQLYHVQENINANRYRDEILGPLSLPLLVHIKQCCKMMTVPIIMTSSTPCVPLSAAFRESPKWSGKRAGPFVQTSTQLRTSGTSWSAVYWTTTFHRRRCIGFLFCTLFIPGGKFWPPYLGKATAATRAARATQSVKCMLGLLVFP